MAVLKSRKFWASVVSLVFVLINAYAPGLAGKLDETTVLGIVGAIAAYVLGVAIEDAGKAALQ